MTTDFKTGPRHKASVEEWESLRQDKLYMRPCRVCRQRADTLHHLVARSLGGDDCAANLVPLCGHGTVGCHGLVEHWDERACLLLGASLTDAERSYVADVKGAYFLKRRYMVYTDEAA